MDYEPSQRRGSQETLISLLQLEPSPIESPAPSDVGKELSTRPDEDDAARDNNRTAKGATAGTPGLRGSGHGAIFYLTRLQKYSSYAFGVFASLHLANVSLVPAITRSVPGSETYLLMTREIYQTTFTEPLLIALPVLSHIGSGIALRLLRRSQNMKRYGGATPGVYPLQSSHDANNGANGRNSSSPWPPLSYISMSGYAFAVFYSAHVVLNRALPLAVDGDSSNIGLAYVAHGFARHPLVSWLSYTGLLVLGNSHMVWGAAKWLGLAPSTGGWWGDSAVGVDKKTRKQRRRKWLTMHGVAAAATVLWAVGGLGVVARGGLANGWIGKLYDDLFAKVGL